MTQAESWGNIRGRRHVLRQSSAEMEVVEFANGAGFEKRREITAVPAEGITREVTWRIGPRLYLHYIEYPPAEACFVQVTGDDRENVDEFDGIVFSYFEPVLPEDMLRIVDDAITPEDRALALRRLGLAAPNESDQRFVDRVVTALDDADVRVREAAVWATLFPLWPDFLPALERVAESDPDEDVRALAEFMVGQIRKVDRS